MSAEEQFKRLSGKYFTNGEYKKSNGSALANVIEPATEDVLGSISDCTSDEVSNVIAASNEAQRKWKETNYLERADIMHEVATKMRELLPLQAEMLTREMGKPYKESADEITWAASAFDYYAEIGRNDCGAVLGSNVDGQMHYTVKEPMGVVVIVMPFNYPLVLLCWEAAAAIAAGNTVIIKPSELTTLSTLYFMEAFEALPTNIVQCVSGAGNVGRQLVESTETHMVAFTGGVETGKLVAKACAEQFKPFLMEASGNDPLIVMPSAPMEFAVRGALFASFLNCGQVCTSAERIYVHEDIHDEFVERLIEAAKGLRLGNGLGKVDIGPMVTSNERERFEGVIENARKQGAKVVFGGGRPKEFNKGWFMEPTILTDVTQDMDIMNNESLGPVAPICRVASFDEAIERANDSKFGLGSTIFTSDLNESHRAVNEIIAGMVWVNSPLLDNDAGPFGGRRMSGIGRQLGAEGLDTFRHTKFAMVDYGSKPQDFWWFPYADGESHKG